MSSRMANTTAKIAAASSGPRQLRTTLLSSLRSNMVQELPLILAVNSNGFWRQCMGPIPNAIELPQAPAEFLWNFRAHLERGLGAPPPPARKLIEVFAI